MIEGIYRNIVYGKYQLVILSSQKLFTTAGWGVLLLSSITRNDLWLCCWWGILYTDMVSSSRWLSLPLIQISPDDTGLRHLLARQLTWNSRMKIVTNSVFGFEQNEELYYSNGQRGGSVQVVHKRHFCAMQETTTGGCNYTWKAG